MYGLLSCQGLGLHSKHSGSVSFQWPVATQEARSFPYGDIPTLCFSVMSQIEKDWKSLKPRNKSVCASLVPKGEQILRNQS